MSTCAARAPIEDGDGIARVLQAPAGPKAATAMIAKTSSQWATVLSDDCVHAGGSKRSAKWARHFVAGNP
jgi:hypothetical protein